jgi:PAS domain S-box-containing protein/putative nucleotidyltransferase with HDIG domain
VIDLRAGVSRKVVVELALALALFAAVWELTSRADLGALGVVARLTAYVLVGGLMIRFLNARNAMEEDVRRHYELSLDLFCTATFDGYFERLNPSWQRVLGWTEADLRSIPLIEFVHPDDRERTVAESARLVEEAGTTASFRNRYRTGEGDYRWLEWSSRAVPSEGRIYATARDITIQKRAEEALQSQSDQLERTIRRRTRALEEARLETLRRLALAAEFRDEGTHEHTERVGRTAALLGRRLGLPDEAVALLRRAAPLHDIGKVGVPDAILLKPGKLNAEELEAMREHTVIGARILAEGKFPVLRLAAEIALTHHERCDGAGYPHGTAGEAIPMSGRIVAVADVFDALTHDRPYKKAWSVEAAVAEIRGLAGTQFDRRVVEAFEALDHRRLLASVEDYDIELPGSQAGDLLSPAVWPNHAAPAAA